MARFLCATWPIPGHFYPNLAVACALRARGHEVAFLSGRRAAEVVGREGFRCIPFEPETDDLVERVFFEPEPTARGWEPRILHLRRRYYEWLVGSLRGQARAALQAIEQWGPDVLVCDPGLWGVYLVAPELSGLPTAIFNFLPFCPLPGPGIPPLGWGLAPPRTIGERVRIGAAQLLFRAGATSFRRAANDLRREFGLSALPGSVTEAAGRLSLYLVAGPRELDYPREEWPPSVRFVGTCAWNRARTAGEKRPAWWNALRTDRPTILVSEGTVHTQHPFVTEAAVAGLADLPVQVILSSATKEDHGLAPIPPNMIVEHWTNIHFGELLPRVDLVVTTGGGGTVMAALEAGVPLVIVPTQWDKPEIASRVTFAGAGISIPPNRCTQDRLRSAVRTVLEDPAFRANARGVQACCRNYSGPRLAAELLEGLAGAFEAADASTGSTGTG